MEDEGQEEMRAFQPLALADGPALPIPHAHWIETLHGRADETAAGEPDSDGEWCVYWETALDDSGPRTRYATQEQAEAAAKLANADLHAHNPGGNLLCGFSVRSLVDGVWTESEVQS